ncbi:unnamed protein product, partial [Rotaria magnacalcarata]
TLKELYLWNNKISNEEAQRLTYELKINKEMEPKIRTINVVKVPKYENQQLLKRITENGNNTSVSLNTSNLTDQDMEIILYVI